MSLNVCFLVSEETDGDIALKTTFRCFMMCILSWPILVQIHCWQWLYQY